VKGSAGTLSNTLEGLGKAQQTQLEGMTKQLKELTESNQGALDRIRITIDSRVKELQDGNDRKLGEMRKEVSDGLRSTGDTLSIALDEMSKAQRTQLEVMTNQLKELTESNQGALDRIRTTFDSHVKELQDGNERKLGEMRKEVSDGLRSTSDMLSKGLEGMGRTQQIQLEGMTKQLRELTDSNQGALDRIRATFDSRVKELQEGNEKRLDEMRRTVDEKLHETLSARSDPRADLDAWAVRKERTSEGRIIGERGVCHSTAGSGQRSGSVRMAPDRF
jgi:DNA recombination protein RmuC